MVQEQMDGLPGVEQDQQANLPDYELNRRYRPEGLAELGDIYDPWRLRNVTREYGGNLLTDSHELGREPNTYRVEEVVGNLTDGEVRARRLLPLGDVDPTIEEVQAGLVATTLKREANEIEEKVLAAAPTFTSNEVFLLRQYGGLEISELNDLATAGQISNEDVGFLLESEYVELPGSCIVREDRLVRVLDQDVLVEMDYWYLNGNQVAEIDKKGKRFYITPDRSEVSEAEARENRERLANERMRSAREVMAWSALLQKLSEQHVFSGDVEAYASQAFTRLGKFIMRAQHYGELLNLPESREGFAEFGKKIEAGFKAFIDVAEGRAVIERPDPNSDTGEMKAYHVPNPFAYAQNKGMKEHALRYVQMRIAAEQPPTGHLSNQDLAEANNHDDRVAAIAASMFFDHWDLDAEYAFDLNFTPQGDLEDIRKFELAMTDYAKVTWANARRNSEYYGHPRGKAGLLKANKERRPYHRAAGSPRTMDVLPKGPGNVLEAFAVNVIATNGKDESKVITLNADQAAFGAKRFKEPTEDEIRDGADPRRHIRTEGGRTVSRIVIKDHSSEAATDENTWTYEVVGLSGIPWDSVQIAEKRGNQLVAVDPDKGTVLVDTSRKTRAEIKRMAQDEQIIEGPNTNSYEVPGKLAGFYFYKIFSEFTRGDYAKQRDEYLKEGKLERLNKTITSGLGFVMRAHGLSKDTQEKYERFIRVSLLAGLVSAVARTDNVAKSGNAHDARAQTQNTHNFESLIKDLVNVVKAENFVQTNEKGNGNIDWKYQEDLKLLKELVRKRKEGGSITPFDLVGRRGNEFSFTKDQIEEIGRMYSLHK